MQRSILYGIIAAAVVAASVGIAFAATMNNMNNNNNTTEPEVASQQSSNEVRVIKHDVGETEITGTPERVVLLDAHSFSIMMELGIEPVGAQTWRPFFFSETEIFWEEYYPGISQEWPNTVDVGFGGEPNLEVLSQLEPDLIIGNQVQEGIYGDLSEIAPTILFTGSPPGGSGLNDLEAAERVTMGITDALNRHDEGVAMIDNFHAKLDENAAKLEAAGLKGKKFVFSQTLSSEGDINERVWDNTSKASLILEGMGLVNAATAPEGIAPTPDGRLENVGLEGLAAMDGPDVHFIYMPSGENPVTTAWKDNPVWNNIPFVKEGRVYSLESNLYLFGGPQKDAEFADRVVEALTASNSNQTG
jgi:ABC-type Fe3+-hydroxamate transport system substrate-binding protein